MHQFYFNDCLPKERISLDELVSLFSNTINEYDSLVKKDIGIDKGIILEREVSNVVVCENELKKVITSISNRETRTLAFAYFTKYPIQVFLKSDDIDDTLLKEEYHLYDLDATNLALANHHNCFLFSIAVHDNLKNNSLQISGNNGVLNIDNLYGLKSNTDYIETLIKRANAASLNSFELLCFELNSPMCTPAFKKAFSSESTDVQLSIIYAFKHAKERNLATRYYPDTKIIKDVTPSNKKETQKANVYELRVYSPKALRVYFYEYDAKVFIAKIGYKADNDQSDDIKKSLMVIDKMIKTR